MSLKFRQVFLFLFAFSGIALAQHDPVYDSAYSINNLHGHATFEYYYDIDHLKVKNGSFEFKTKNADTAWTTINQEQAWKGHYAENKKDGEWTYTVVKHELDITDIKDDHLEYSLRTIRTEIFAHYKKGVPSGEWTFNSTLTEKDRPPRFYERIKLTFKKGLAQGEYQHELLEKSGNIAKVNGLFNKGLFEGRWELSYTDENYVKTNETRIYVNGILTDLIKIKGEQTDSIHFKLSPATQTVLQENSKGHLINKPYSIVYNDGFPTASIYIQSQEDGNKLLKRAHSKLGRFDQALLKKQKFFFGANRGKYPLSEEDEKYITQWYRAEQDFQFVVDDVKAHEIRDFGKSEDSIALYAIAWVEHQEALFERFNALGKIFLSKEIEYYYREDLLLKRALELLSKDVLRIKKKEFVIEYPVDPEYHQNVFAYLWANYQQRINTGKAIDQALYDVSSSSSVNDEFERLPAIIKEEKAKLDSIKQPKRFSKNSERLLLHIDQDFVEGTIKRNYERFIELKNKTEKKQLRDSILLDLNDVSHIYTTSIKISEQADYIDSLYTEYVFDAFTFSDNVPARIKKRLYDQVQKIQNELLAQAVETKTPKECLEVLTEMKNVQDILIFLRDKPTRALEKELSRANTLEQKLEILYEVL
jgi:hypothetical protein